MCEVTKHNFKKIYPQVETAISEACCIAIDTELTGIKKSNAPKESLFDSIPERYDKLKHSIEPFLIIQFGISTFHRVKEQNKYEARSFNFFLFPRAIPGRSKDITWQAAAIEFLSLHNFDFNKVAHHGISFLNETEEVQLQQLLSQLDQNFDCLQYNEEEKLRQHCYNVSEWLKSASSEDNQLTLETKTPLLQFITHKELRRRFDNVWTVAGENSVIAFKVGNDIRDMLIEEEVSSLQNIVLESYVGFSKVFKLLVNCKKPIIGHNCLLDFMFMHQQFYKPLPEKYNDFKASIHSLFPTIYDTKCLSFELKERLDKADKWKTNSLSDLFVYFTSGPGTHLVFNGPIIQISDKLEEKYHDAGWDAYVTGHVFLKLAHVFTAKKYGEGAGLRLWTTCELMNSMKNFSNCLNMIRGSTSYLKLDGPDPQTSRPQWLFVKTLQPKTATTRQVAEELGSFGSVDVTRISYGRLLVAVANTPCARDILSHYQSNKKLQIVPYNPLRHSPKVKFFLWSGSILSTGIIAWAVHRILNKPLNLDVSGT